MRILLPNQLNFNPAFLLASHKRSDKGRLSPRLRGAGSMAAAAEEEQLAAETRQLWAEARSSVAKGCCLLLGGLLVLGLFVWSMPPLKPQELDTVLHNFPPESIQSVKALRDTLLTYAETYPKTVAVAILMAYVMMQTFAIPGTIFLSLLAGALYDASRGFALVAVVSTLGSCSCYGMSLLFGRPIARALWRHKLDDFAAEVAKRGNDLLSYIIFLRVTPILPNVFINVASPIVGVPIWEFMLGTLIGCAPNNFMAANAGDHLSDLNSLADLYSPRMLLLGLVVGAVALLPVVVKHRHERAMTMLAHKIR